MAIVNIIVENDADFYRAFQFVEADGTSPIDITGGTMEMMLRRHAEDADALLRLATDSGEIVVTNAAQGKFTVMIQQIVLERLGLGDFAHSNIMTTPGGLKRKVWSGTLTNNAGPTR
jgi:hypothetical protein